MISILIPIYNYKVGSLVISIYQQLKLLNVNYEIICINDASTEFINENKEIVKFENTYIIDLDKNVGRSKIRNLLVEKSQYNWLLFLDADVIPQKDTFIKKYIDCIKSRNELLYFGGVVNNEVEPLKNRTLRWVYGKKREDIPYEKRQNKPYKYFLGANFLVKKEVFFKTKFDENIVTYGYEDFLFGECLKEFSIKIIHINNPIIHNGVDETLVFINKTKEALKNLYSLNLLYPEKFSEVKLLKIFKVIKTIKITGLFSLGYKIFEKLIERSLNGTNPSLLLFDVYKLGYFCFISHNSKNNFM